MRCHTFEPHFSCYRPIFGSAQPAHATSVRSQRLRSLRFGPKRGRKKWRRKEEKKKGNRAPWITFISVAQRSRPPTRNELILHVRLSDFLRPWTLLCLYYESRVWLPIVNTEERKKEFGISIIHRQIYVHVHVYILSRHDLGQVWLRTLGWHAKRRVEV